MYSVKKQLGVNKMRNGSAVALFGTMFEKCVKCNTTCLLNFRYLRKKTKTPTGVKYPPYLDL